MEGDISCDDPQFVNILRSCLLSEIDAARQTSSTLQSEVKQLKWKVRLLLESRKELKERARHTMKNISLLSNNLNRQKKYANELTDKIELMKLNLDNDYKVMKLESEKYERILEDYERTWESYKARYEEFPLAKVRREARISLEKLRIERMVAEYKINEFNKISSRQKSVDWLRLRGNIVEFARMMVKHGNLKGERDELRRSIADRTEELNKVNIEIAAKVKRQEEEKKIRALKLLEMPPPRVNFSHMRKLYGRSDRSSHQDDWKQNQDVSIDTLSVDTLVLEELYRSEENTYQTNQRMLNEPQTRKPCTPEVNRSPLANQDEKEAEYNDVVNEIIEEAEEPTEMDEAGNQIDEESDQENREGTELPLTVDENKQTENEEEDRVEKDDPVAKKMRLLNEEGKIFASPAGTLRSTRLERKTSQLTDRSYGPRITRIEPVQYNLSPVRRNNQGKLKPSSMFTPGRFDFSDLSDTSFSLKDQLSMYGGSIRDLCECSNISTPMEDMDVDGEIGNEGILPANQPRNFQQFDFGNAPKDNPGRLNLF